MRLHTAVLATLLLASTAPAQTLRPGDVVYTTLLHRGIGDVNLPGPGPIYPSEGVRRLDPQLGSDEIIASGAVTWAPRHVSLAPDGSPIVGTDGGFVRVDRVTRQQTLIAAPIYYKDMAVDALNRLLILGSTVTRVDIGTGEVEVLPRLPTFASDAESNRVVVGPQADVYVTRGSGPLVSTHGLDRSFRIYRYVDLDGSWVSVTAEPIRGLFDIAVDEDGALVMALWSRTGARILRIDPDTGAITPIVELPPELLPFERLALAPDGSFYLGLAWSIARVDPASGHWEFVVSRPDGAAATIGGIEVVPLPEPSTLRIEVDPWTRAKSLRLRQGFPIPVAILSSPAADATRVSLDSLAFGPSGAAPLRESASEVLHWVGDVDRDGRQDLTVFFDPDETGLVPGIEEACLDGVLDRPFRECDALTVMIAGCARAPAASPACTRLDGLRPVRGRFGFGAP